MLKRFEAISLFDRLQARYRCELAKSEAHLQIGSSLLTSRQSQRNKFPDRYLHVRAARDIRWDIRWDIRRDASESVEPVRQLD